ncbi:MAG: hypothetical protein IKA73_00670 [Alphaproteobacteria bacterium]|nr:hypothetical protein [Alphaproteobacteria bacterium]MBR2482906.1 hypothetical protein [Alphaproteobacteria bacterium]
MSNLKYVYLLRNPETGNIIRRVYGHKQCAMSIDELFKLMRRGMPIASPFRFQIGVQISSEKDTKTVWQKSIYTIGTIHNGYVYNLKGKPYKMTQKDIAITPDFFNIFDKNTGKNAYFSTKVR